MLLLGTHSAPPSAHAARFGTVHELTKLEPVPIIADAVGYHPSSIERDAIGSAQCLLPTDRSQTPDGLIAPRALS